MRNATLRSPLSPLRKGFDKLGLRDLAVRRFGNAPEQLGRELRRPRHQPPERHPGDFRPVAKRVLRNLRVRGEICVEGVFHADDDNAGCYDLQVKNIIWRYDRP